MTPAELALARRAVACAGWRWVPGMRSTCGRIVYAAGHVFAVGVYVGDQRVRPSCSALPHDALPDLTDPATLGCLLALVREAWGRDDIAATKNGRGPDSVWLIACTGTPDRLLDIAEPTEAAALVAALEAANVNQP